MFTEVNRCEPDILCMDIVLHRPKRTAWKELFAEGYCLTFKQHH